MSKQLSLELCSVFCQVSVRCTQHVLSQPLCILLTSSCEIFAVKVSTDDTLLHVITDLTVADQNLQMRHFTPVDLLNVVNVKVGDLYIHNI